MPHPVTVQRINVKLLRDDTKNRELSAMLIPVYLADSKVVLCKTKLLPFETLVGPKAKTVPFDEKPVTSVKLSVLKS